MWPDSTGCQKAVAGHSEKTGSQKAWATAQVLPLLSWEALDKLPQHLWLQLTLLWSTNKIHCKVAVRNTVRLYPPKPLLGHWHKVGVSFLESCSVTIDLPGYEANYNHPGVWCLLLSILCLPTGIKRTKVSKGFAQILAVCHKWNVVKPFRRTSRVTDTFQHFLLWTQSNHNSPCKVLYPNLNFLGVKAFRCSLQKACSGRWGTWRRG